MRVIMHVDMDAFFASVEQRDHPELQGKPVVVGGSPTDRGVVAAASYEARKFGVRSAMPMSKALRLCPDAIRVPPNFQAYRQASLVIREHFLSVTDLVEPVSIDEAYLDISTKVKDFSDAEAIGTNLKQTIRESTKLTASVGIGPNKFLAKIASDYQKPDGLFMIQPAEIIEFLSPLPIRVIPGIGPKTEQRLHEKKIQTVGELRTLAPATLQQYLGEKYGQRLYELAQGMDDTPVVTSRKRKSLSKERTFSYDLSDRGQMMTILRELSHEVAARLHELQLQGRTIGIKVRLHDFTNISRAISLDFQTSDKKEIYQQCEIMMNALDLQGKKVRLIGVRVAGFDPVHHEREESVRQDELQLTLW